MKFHITPEVMEAAYELLRTTPPFKGWKLPSPDDIEFHVTAAHDCYGQIYDHGPMIEVSVVHNPDLETVIATMAHEMVHLREIQLAKKAKRPWGGSHGKKFQSLADQVCRSHPHFNRAKF